MNKKIIYGTGERYAVAMTKDIDEASEEQIKMLLSTELADNSDIRIMPDVHAGKGCVIGLTMTVNNRVAPNLVGVDIGCGLITVALGKVDLDVVKMNNVISDNIPSGFKKRETVVPNLQIDYLLDELSVFDDSFEKDRDVFLKSIGTLGGGNHFIEISEDEKGFKYLIIHSGSRNLGTRVAEKHYEKAKKHCELIPVPESLSYLEGEDMERYLKDMKICAEYAKINREIMADIILREYFGETLSDFEYYHTVHNYVSDDYLRKGAVSAQLGELLTIPLNMRDGTLLCMGKGNRYWNLSAPHGAGRKLSRKQAKESLNFEDYKESMDGVYSTTIKRENIDESPFCYKDKNSIMDNIKDIVIIAKRLKPILNYKG